MDKPIISDFSKSHSNFDENHLITDVITRYCAQDLPYHIAINDFYTEFNNEKYCIAHAHENEVEINIFLSHKNFEILGRVAVSF